MKCQNLLSHIPETLSEELFDTLLQTRQFRLERIVSKGHASPVDFWYQQERAEWVLLVKGEAGLRYADGREVTLREGDHLVIASGDKHQVAWTAADTETIWLALHYCDD